MRLSIILWLFKYADRIEHMGASKNLIFEKRELIKTDIYLCKLGKKLGFSRYPYIYSNGRLLRSDLEWPL